MDFSEHEIDMVWKKRNPHTFPNRGYDVCGAEIDKDAYGNRSSAYGWEIDHIVPISQGGRNHIDNLQPLHWKNNQQKGDLTQAEWQCRGGYRQS